MRRILDGLYLFAGYLAGFFLVVVFLLMLALPLGRKVGFNIPAGDEFASWSMAAMAFLGLAYAFKAGEIIRVGIVLDRVRGPARRWIELACLGLGGALVGFFAWHAAWMVYDSWRFNDMAQGVLAVPLWIPQIGYAAGLVILFVAFVDEILHVLAGNPPRYDKPPPATPEEVVARAAESGI